MPRRMIYVREADQDLWTQAEKLAKRDGESLAAVVAAALSAYVRRKQQSGSLPATSSTVAVGNMRAREQAAIKQMEDGLAVLKRGVKGGRSR